MINLDDRETVLKLQGGDAVLQSIDGLSNQLDQAWQESQNVTIPKDYKGFKNIMVVGMGGSRFPSLIISELFKEELKIPLIINDNYLLPSWVDDKTLVILSSYSGTTEEVLTCLEKATSQKAKLIGITTGGDIEKILKEKKHPIYVFNPIYNPSGQPRIGVGYAVGGLLGILFKLGLIDYQHEKITEAIANLDELQKNNRLDIPTEQNAAKQMAQKIFDAYPYYVVSEFLTGAGNAIQNQTNETAKSISSYRVIPELNHHLMEGLKHPKDHTDLAIFILFYSSLYSERIKKRFEITKEVIEQNGIETIWCELQGKSKVEQVFELIGFGGYLTMYLSTLYGEDPTVIPFVDYFKKKLKEESSPSVTEAD